MLGESVQLMVPLVPLAAGIGLGFAIMSYADQLTIGMNADAARVRDIWKLAEALRESFEELWTATGLERVTVAPKVEPALKRRQRQHAAGSSPADSGPADTTTDGEPPGNVG
jgi:hypothetical protein